MIKVKSFRNNKFETKQISEKDLGLLADGYVWLDLEAPSRNELAALQKKFDFHPLTIEESFEGASRPKAEEFDDYLFIVFKYLNETEINGRAACQQISFYFTKNFIISIHKKSLDSLMSVESILGKNTELARKPASYLLYLIIDQIVDNYFPYLEKIARFQDKIEKSILSDPQKEIVNEIFILKREINNLYHLTLSQSEIINRLSRGEFKLISRKDDLFLFRNVHDHLYHLIEQLANYKDMMTSSLDAYLSSLSNKMNEIMKVLTIIATLVMPPTLIAGIYGMNFQFMPELDARWGYPFALGLMFLVGLVMVAYFKKKKWL